MAAGTQTLTASAPQSVSRYRALRGKSVSAPRDALSVFNDNGNEQDSLSASHLRGRSKSVTAVDLAQFPAAPPTPALPLAPRAANIAAAPRLADVVKPQATHKFAFHRHRTAEVYVGIDGERDSRIAREQEEARRLKEAEEAALWADEVARLEAETDRILAEQRNRDIARAQATQIHHLSPRYKPRTPVLDKFVQFTKGRRSNGSHTATSLASSTTVSMDSTRASSQEASPPPKRFIQAGGKGIVPQTDAPVNASNAGERRIVVRCMQSSVTLPITLETTPVDILFSSANIMTHSINPATSIVIESYLAFGLERRLRRYERIRDVMNSWDRDNQNALLVLPCDTPEDGRDLDIESAKRGEQSPPGFTFQLYHCGRVGRWNKRYITLLEGGQMFSAKKPDLNPTDKDVVTLCHLTDFDIYTPTEAQTKKALKPPRKFCYAVKSQQKSAVFPNGENFVHFFCTDDAAVAHKFHELVHAWRSWYLVNRKADVYTSSDTTPQIRADRSAPKKSMSVVKSGNHRLKVSVDETPYTIGAFRPLMDLDRFDKPIEEFGKNFLPESQPAAKPVAKPVTKPVAQPVAQPVVTHRAKEIPRPKRLAKANPQPPVQRVYQKDAEFDSKGLLGDSYAERREGNNRRASIVRSGMGGDGPFTEGPSLLNGGRAEPQPRTQWESPRSEAKPWFPSATEHTAKERDRERSRTRTAILPRPSTSDGSSDGGRRKPRPQVDTSTRLPEPPNHWREARGHGIRAPAGAPLIDFATGPRNQNRHIDAPPRNLSVRMDARPGPPVSRGPPPQAYGARPRSRSTAGVQSPGRRSSPDGRPPMPPLPAQRGAYGDNGYGARGSRGTDREREYDRGRGRDPGEQALRGRSDTVRY